MDPWSDAEAWATQARWDKAALAYLALADDALGRGDGELAADCCGRAGDAWRRDDRPARAAAALRRAMDLGRRAVVDHVGLAGVLLETGELSVAADLADRARAMAAAAADRALAVDTAAGIALARGRVEEARGHVEALDGLGLPGAEIASRFRRAQLDRLDGLLDRAVAGHSGLAAMLAPHEAAAGPCAAAHAEAAETRVLRAVLLVASGADPAAELEAAGTGFDAAEAAWTRAGRRAGLFRAAAWKLRLAVRAGARVATGALDGWIEFAAEREMPLLRAELLVARAELRRSPLDALHAAELAAEAPLASARARVVAAEVGGSRPVSSLYSALRPDAAWTARAMIADPSRREEGIARARAMLGA
jgi:hypothetical protein